MCLTIGVQFTLTVCEDVFVFPNAWSFVIAMCNYFLFLSITRWQRTEELILHTAAMNDMKQALAESQNNNNGMYLDVVLQRTLPCVVNRSLLNFP